MAKAAQQGQLPIFGGKLHDSRAFVALSLIFLAHTTCGFLSLWPLRGVKKSTTGFSLRSTVSATTTDSDVPKLVCPRCEDLFTRLEEETGRNPGRDQEVRIHLRGEPKTGTGIMSSWAVGALTRTCELLQDSFGTASCRVEHNSSKIAGAGANHEWTMVFEPQLSPGDQKCSCDAVGRVSIEYSDRVKHKLPVHDSCPWSHVFGIPSYSDGCRTLAKGEPVKNYADMRSCMQETPCEITDHALQFATFRDPRAEAVSTYFWIETHTRDVAHYAPERVNLNRTLDESIMEILESVCLWTSTRHILFNDLIGTQSVVFSYDEAKEDVLEWHYRWTHMAGLNLPVAWVKDIAALAEGDKWASLTQGVNPHPGGEQANVARTWRDEVSPELWDDMDAVVQRWLPCSLTERLGLSCTSEAEVGEGA